MDEHNADALCARAEAYIDQELYDEGDVAHTCSHCESIDHTIWSVDEDTCHELKLILSMTR